MTSEEKPQCPRGGTGELILVWSATQARLNTRANVATSLLNKLEPGEALKTISESHFARIEPAIILHVKIGEQNIHSFIVNGRRPPKEGVHLRIALIGVPCLKGMVGVTGEDIHGWIRDSAQTHTGRAESSFNVSGAVA